MRWPQRVQTSPSDSNNAPRSVTRRIRLTNPCDPLAGAEVEFVQGPRTRSDDWVLVKLPGGELRMVRKTWTSLVPEDGYELIGSGASTVGAEGTWVLLGIVKGIDANVLVCYKAHQTCRKTGAARRA
jgi:hypothetical protein